MLLWLLHTLLAIPATSGDPLPAWAKTTFRAALAAKVAFLLVWLLGPQVIAALARRFREPNRSDSAKLELLHQHKASTPTLGGLLLLAGLVAALAVAGDWRNYYLQLAMAAALALAGIGLLDDLIKLSTRRKGLSAKAKLVLQTIVALAIALLLHQYHGQGEAAAHLVLPLAGVRVHLGWWFIPLGTLVIVAASNAVNLTDGLDGLAAGCSLFAWGAISVVAYACGHAELAEYLHLPRLAGAHELLVLSAAMLGSLLGFLWFNSHPAQVFMGDTGSLPLGGLLGVVAVATRQEALLVIVGGVFVAEAASVVLQVAVYRWRGKRVLLCAPLHHHFQFRGWPENKIVVRFWIAAALCALLGLASLRIQVWPKDTLPGASRAALTQRTGR
jgi:phospho-N-acetylmuramoyl-pentapeptide-transferase